MVVGIIIFEYSLKHGLRSKEIEMEIETFQNQMNFALDT